MQLAILICEGIQCSPLSVPICEGIQCTPLSILICEGIQCTPLSVAAFEGSGWWGGAMVLGKLPVPWRPTILMKVGQAPTALAAGAGGGGLDI